jgi:hypothetical protein
VTNGVHLTASDLSLNAACIEHMSGPDRGAREIILIFPSQRVSRTWKSLRSLVEKLHLCERALVPLS